MNKKNFIKGTALPVALFFSMVTMAPVLGLQPVSAAADKVQQQTVIQGTVVDDKGEPVIGANVIAEGTTNGTITNIDGIFKLNVRPGSKLKISFIGYSDQIVAAKNGMRVVLVEDATTLQEVEVVAYGAQKSSCNRCDFQCQRRRINENSGKFGYQCTSRSNDRFDQCTIFR